MPVSEDFIRDIIKKTQVILAEMQRLLSSTGRAGVDLDAVGARLSALQEQIIMNLRIAKYHAFDMGQEVLSQIRIALSTPSGAALSPPGT